MNEERYAPDEALGDLVLPTTSAIGTRNAALSGTAPHLSAISLVSAVTFGPGTISFTPTAD